MTFEEKSERFKKKTEEEQNQFKQVYRTVFLNEKIKEREKEEWDFYRVELKNKRPKDHRSAKLLIK